MAPLLGVSWSPAAAALRDLSYFVDIVETPGWTLDDALAAGHSRALLHNLDRDVSLAAPDAIDDGWAERARAAVSRSESLWLSLHLGFSAERVRYEGNMRPLSATLSRDEAFDRISVAAKRAAEALTVPVLLENLDYCPGGAYEHVCEPEFITAVLEESGCGLLLDLGHLQVTASHLGTCAEEMLTMLPLERVMEVHISSPRPVEGQPDLLWDAHGPLEERDLDLLRATLEKCQPRMVTVEFRENPEQLRTQLLQVGRVLKRRPRPRPC